MRQQLFTMVKCGLLSGLVFLLLGCDRTPNAAKNAATEPAPAASKAASLAAEDIIQSPTKLACSHTAQGNLCNWLAPANAKSVSGPITYKVQVKYDVLDGEWADLTSLASSKTSFLHLNQSLPSAMVYFYQVLAQADGEESASNTAVLMSPPAPGAYAPVALAPIGSVPVASVPVASVPVASVPVTSVPVASAPVGSAPVASAPVASAPAPASRPQLSATRIGYALYRVTVSGLAGLGFDAGIFTVRTNKQLTSTSPAGTESNMQVSVPSGASSVSVDIALPFGYGYQTGVYFRGLTYSLGSAGVSEIYGVYGSGDLMLDQIQ